MEITGLNYIVILAVVSSCDMSSTCPKGCLCAEGQEDHLMHVTCEGRDSIPQMKNVQSINMSANSMSVIHGKSVEKTSTLKMLDLSFNNINMIEIGALGSGGVPNLVMLNLSHNHLTSVPKNLTSSLQYVRLSSNDIEIVHLSDLCHLKSAIHVYLEHNKLREIIPVGQEDENCGDGLEKLEILSFHDNFIEKIDKTMWKCVSGVTYLSFANNRIQTLKQDVFKGLRGLKYLDLTGNRIKTIHSKTFKHLWDLKFLSLSRNYIEDIPDELPMTEWFDVSHNRITEVPEKKKGSLYPQEVFLFGQNPLNCGCEMLWLKELFDTREYQLKFLDVETDKFIPACSTPSHLHGDTWDVLANEAFGCNEPHSGTANEDEDDHLLWRLKDLSVRVTEIGDTYLKVEWDSVNIGVPTKEKHVVVFNIHKFGRKKHRTSISVHPQVGRYVLKALSPATGYVICVTVVSEKLHEPRNSYSSDNCLEIVTRETTVTEASWVWEMLVNPTFYLSVITLSVLVLYFNVW
ncbi:SLIT and NTRK-like protein 2 [Haliotis rubra]|uniref:SLIT and NTRK-like protein 2 n=1 Tax=Haliotis rubra TaxID=36100 RepID=UPI001EE59699|nr:SLIT and NTRK-like protein 2 [Haliotis rubra]XP_046568896.1 SLIT and NTRK-like protein 2 [Haliotis rubra]